MATLPDLIDYSIVILLYNEGGVMQTMDSIFNGVIVPNPYPPLLSHFR